MSDRWSEVARILDVALDLAPEQRPAFLDEACAGDRELRVEVEAILVGADADAFLKDPAVVLAAPMLDATAPPDAAGALIGPYRLVHELGHGGMGMVYLAERADGHFEQRVALKLIKRGMDSDEILRRFVAERQVLARLNHQHIARLLDGGLTADGQPWFAMEYVGGVPLHRYCDEGGLGLEERLEVFGKVCEAVQYAHRSLVVHRDLKPSNILVTPSGEIKLLDFGIAKALTAETDDETVTRAEHRLMTPEYAAPEQLRGEPVTTATDVYALGAILYLLVTGRPAHQLAGRTPAERDRRTARAQRMLGLCLVALGKRPEAEKLLLASYRTLASAKNWYHRTLRERTLQDLVALYESWDRPAEAGKYRGLLTGGVARATSASVAP